MKPSIGVKEAVEQRRAARAFRPDVIPRVILEEILRLSLHAPSGFNLQPWRFIVVRDRENKEKLKACAFNQRQVTEAPVVLICCGDRRVLDPDYIESVISLGMKTGAIADPLAEYMRSAIPKIFENKPSFENIETWTNRQTMLAVAHLMIVAKSYGVDSCPMEGFIASEVKAAFNIPEEVDVCCLLPLGYAAEPMKPYGGRFETDQLVYSEKFGQPFHR